MKIGIFPNLSKEHITEHVDELCRHLSENGIEFYLIDSYRQEAGERRLQFRYENWASFDEVVHDLDIAISLGGDGTIIGVAKLLVDHDIPICGVNLGDLGFLNVIEPDELDRRLQMIKAGEYALTKRYLLASYLVHQDGTTRALPLAMNEVVVGRSKPGRMARLQLHINGVYTEEYPADGIIIATATGSTGYALSCNGPIMHPSMPNMLVTPICPHLLLSAPLLLEENDEVMIAMPERQKQLHVSVDGNESFRFDQHTRLVIRKHEQPVPFLHFRDQNFFKLLFPKLTKSIYHVISQRTEPK